jgi:glycosyltransferase involved in cell wall biosynthesis
VRNAGTIVVVPTRNRAEMATLAIQSVVDQASSDVAVVVSDNSTSDDEVALLTRYCSRFDDDEVRYVRPPEPLPMPQHWQWALHAALDSFAVERVLYLTDRMVFKPGELPQLLRIAGANPDRVVTYNHDTVLDHVRPIRLRLEPWSGRLFEIQSSHLLFLSSRAVIHPALPRMLNCVVPREVISAVEERFGTVFASISPDFCFAYRCLEQVPSILYWDRAPLLQHGLSRSNGSSYARGVNSPDRQDFASELKGVPMNFASPVPEFHTIRNAILHEYAFVKAESQSSSFPPIDPRGYLPAIIEDLSLFEDRDSRRRALQVLADNGWVGGSRKRYDAAMVAVRLMFYGWDAARAGYRAVSRLVPSASRFDTVEEAIQFASRNERAPETELRHLEALFTPGGSARELDVIATTRQHREAPPPG